MTSSSGNVFLDMGFPPEEARNLLLRSSLMIDITEMIRAAHLTQARAAKLFGVTQPRISDLMRGKINLFSVDTLLAMLTRAGFSFDIKVAPPRAA